MENAFWKKKQYTAFEISEDYYLEKEIRKASGRKEIVCPDHDCSKPILRYCHGEKKEAYFAHLNNCKCDYAIFDKENTEVMRKIKRKIYNSFCNQGLYVQLEIKVIPKHYTHLLITMSNHKKIAVELVTQRTTAKKIDDLMDEYNKANLEVKWIVIDNNTTPVNEKRTYFTKRYMLNENKKKDLLVLDCNGEKLIQYTIDPNKYKYKGKPVVLNNYPEIYSEEGNLEKLVFEDGELTIDGFNDRYLDWLNKKDRAFVEKYKQLEDEYEKYKNTEYEDNKSTFSKQSLNSKTDLNEISYEERRNSILDILNQQTTQARDLYDNRWIKCEKCSCVEVADKFSSYGGNNHANLGICNNCSKQKH